MRGMLACLVVVMGSVSGVARADAPSEIAAWNKAYDDATRKMDTPALLAMWADDGISLLPQTAPIVGKPAIGKFLDGVMASLKGAKMKTFDDACHDIQAAGDLATEWCEEHQLVDLGGGKTFEGWGKMLLVLHKGSDGKWKLAREMWNEAVKPAAPAPAAVPAK